MISKIRGNGCKQDLLNYRLNFASDLVIEGDLSRESGYLAMKDLNFTVVFVINHLMAMGTIQALKEVGIKMPE